MNIHHRSKVIRIKGEGNPKIIVYGLTVNHSKATLQHHLDVRYSSKPWVKLLLANKLDKIVIRVLLFSVHYKKQNSLNIIFLSNYLVLKV